MRKALLLLLSIMILQTPVLSASKKMLPATSADGDTLPSIFIYTIPDDTPAEKSDKYDTDAPGNAYINDNFSYEEDAAIILETEEDDSDYITLGATVLKGYAQYIEDSSVIYLKDNNDNFVLNIKTPQKISASNGLDLTKNTQAKKIIQYTDTEYIIAPSSIKSSAKTGNFTIGALYNNEINNNAMLESEAGLFTKYEKSKFALSSSVKKSLNTTYAQDYNTISLTPELTVNNYLSLKNTLSADITRNRRSSELTFSLNPFGKTDSDRMLLEAGAKQTYYLDTGQNKTQINFSATFKL